MAGLTRCQSMHMRTLPRDHAGDMDSARPEVLDFYRRHGAEVIDLSEDQDSTDLHKCLAYIEQRFSREQLQRLHILVVGALLLSRSNELSFRLSSVDDSLQP